MAVGLGMTQEEWAELKSKVDDSFWVMRIIGTSIISYLLSSSSFLKHLSKDIRPYQMTTMVSHAELTSKRILYYPGRD